jgi:anti-anti-sigma regulatory factor
MIPQGVEVRPDLQLQNNVLAFGFAGERITDQTAVGLLGGDLLEHLLTTTETSRTGLVVVDMRNVDPLSTAGLGQLRAVQKRLSQVPWTFVLLIDDAVDREVFSNVQAHQHFLAAADETELRELVKRLTPGPLGREESPLFSESERAEMEAAGTTLEDAIRVIEGPRR